MRTKLFAAVVLICVWVCGFAAEARGQCAARWQPVDERTRAFSGGVQQVLALEGWDPDGTGPQEEWLAVGGEFDVCGDVASHQFALWDTTRAKYVDSALRPALSSLVVDFCKAPDGGLYLLVEWGGWISWKTSVMHWNGAGFRAVGDIIPGELWSIETSSDGTIVVLRAGGTVRFDGTAWVPQPTDGLTWGFHKTKSGELYAYGAVVQRWTGERWEHVGSHPFQDDITSLDSNDSGELIACSGNEEDVRSVERWDGTAWESVLTRAQANGMGVNAIVAAKFLPTGELLMIGRRSHQNNVWSLFLWDGATLKPALDESLLWSGAIGSIHVLASGRVFVGGEFAWGDDPLVENVAEWTREGLTPLSTGVSGSGIERLEPLADGRIVALNGWQHAFRGLGGRWGMNLSLYDGEAWSDLGLGLNAGIDTSQRYLDAALTRAGELVVAGIFESRGSPSIRNLAIWNGTAWRALPPRDGGSMGGVHQVEVSADGTIFVAGPEFSHVGGLAKFDGVNWSGLSGGVNGTVSAMRALKNGDLVVGGSFTSVGKGLASHLVARWSNGTWSDMSVRVLGEEPVEEIANTVRVTEIVERGDGVLFISGAIRFPEQDQASWNHVLQWKGERWEPVGTETKSGRIALAPDDSIVLVGGISSPEGQSLAQVSRWRDEAWTPQAGARIDGILDIAVLPSKEVIASGTILHRTPIVLPLLARFSAQPVSLDFNNDGLTADLQDLLDFVDVLGGGGCGACDGVDFNGDGVSPDMQDLLDFVYFFGGGSC